MKRIVLGVLVVALLILSVPPLRQRAQPTIDRISAALAGPLSPAVNPYRELEAEGAISKVIRAMVRDRNSGFIRPEDDEFTDYMVRKIEDEDGIDPWGTPYILQSTRDSVAVISAGPDLEYGTDDDIRESIRYGEPSEYRRSRR